MPKHVEIYNLLWCCSLRTFVHMIFIIDNGVGW